MRIGATMRRMSALAGLMALLATGGVCGEGPPDPADLVMADLVGETASIAPGTPLWVDLRLAVKPGWHVYGQNPGDSGLPTAIDWELPPGFSQTVVARFSSWPTRWDDDLLELGEAINRAIVSGSASRSPGCPGCGTRRSAGRSRSVR